MHQLLLDIPTSLSTDRLKLRCYRHGDGESYFLMLQNNKEHLNKAANHRLLSISNEDEAEIYLREIINDWAARKRFVFGVWNHNNDFVAEIWIEANDWDNRVFEIGWFVEKNSLGKGYVTEAAKKSLQFIFKNLQGHKVIVTTDENNQKSYRVAERCSFIREGCLRKQKFKNGTWVNILYYGLLKEEFKEKKPDI